MRDAKTDADDAAPETDQQASAPSPRAKPKLEPRMTFEKVALVDIDFEDTTFQHRLSTEHNKNLRESIEREGLRQPIDLVGPKPYRIADGFGRGASVREMGWTEIAACIHHNMTDQEARQLAFTKNFVRKNLSPLEVANAVLKEKEQGTTMQELEVHFGMSERQVERYLEVCDFPTHIKDICGPKGVSMAHAKALADFEIKNGKKWKARIIAEGLSAKALMKVLKKEKRKSTGGAPRRYFKCENGLIRGYEYTVSLSAPKEEKHRFIRALRSVLELAESSATENWAQWDVPTSRNYREGLSCEDAILATRMENATSATRTRR